MYDTFRAMIKDIFNNDDFTETCYINGFETKCICSSIDGGVMFSDSGMVNDVNFTLDIEIKETDRLPKQNDRLIFRNKEYKISNIDIDSALATMKLYLISNSKGK